jgi:hypothetical protein
MKNSDKGCSYFFIVFFILLPYSVALYTWMLMLNWNWFATSLGAPNLNFFQALGISLVVDSFKGMPKSDPPDEDEDLKDIVIGAFGKITARFVIFVIAGYVLKHWILGP